MINFKKRSSRVKMAALVSLALTLLSNFLPENALNLAEVPGYLGWFLIPFFIIFSVLCICFGVDFVSSFHPSEGPWRKILLALFTNIAFFVVIFIVVAIIGEMIFLITNRRMIR